MTLRLTPLSCSIRRSSSRNGASSRSRQHRAQRGFSGAAQPDQRDASAPCREIDSAEVLHQQPAGFGQFRRRQASQEFGGVHQVDRRLRSVEHQRLQRNVERVRDLAQQQNRDVALAGFELRQVALGDARVAGEDLAGHAAASAGLADAFAQQREVIGFGDRGRRFDGRASRAARSAAVVLVRMHYVALSAHGGCIILPDAHV